VYSVNCCHNFIVLNYATKFNDSGGEVNHTLVGFSEARSFKLRR
jgi:hypothetical protein